MNIFDCGGSGPAHAKPTTFQLPMSPGRIPGSNSYVEATTALSLSHAKDRLLSCSLDGSIHLWSLTHIPKLQLKRLASNNAGDRIGSCALSRLGDKALVAGEGYLNFMDLQGGNFRILEKYNQSADCFNSHCCFLPNRTGDDCILGFDHVGVCLWDTRQPPDVAARSFLGSVTTFAPSPDGLSLLTASNYLPLTRLWDFTTGKIIRESDDCPPFALGSAIDSRGTPFLLSEGGAGKGVQFETGLYAWAREGSFDLISPSAIDGNDPCSKLVIDWEDDVLSYCCMHSAYVYDISKLEKGTALLPYATFETLHSWIVTI